MHIIRWQLTLETTFISNMITIFDKFALFVAAVLDSKFTLTSICKKLGLCNDGHCDACKLNNTLKCIVATRSLNNNKLQLICFELLVFVNSTAENEYINR